MIKSRFNLVFFFKNLDLSCKTDLYIGTVVEDNAVF